MNVQDFFIVWQDIGLILYSVLKAFLPLPSLEVILVPLVLHSPQKWLLYSLEGAVGTCIGGAIGYGIARILGKKVLYNIAAKEDVEHGEKLMESYGLLAVFIGGITPIPDFLLAYLAGFTNMRLFPFLLCDGFARLLRSLLVTLSLRYLGTVMNVDAFGTWFSLAIMLWLVWKWWKSRKKIQAQTTSRK